MRLLNCQRCHDLRKIRKGVCTCTCGRSSAYYVDPRWVEYKGPARIIGISNEEYGRASPGENYRWFVVPDGHNIRKVDDPKSGPKQNKTDKTNKTDEKGDQCGQTTSG